MKHFYFSGEFRSIKYYFIVFLGEFRSIGCNSHTVKTQNTSLTELEKKCLKPFVHKMAPWNVILQMFLYKYPLFVQSFI